MYKIIIGFFLTLISAPQTFGQTGHLLRYPDLDPEGKRIAFAYQGDIWVADISGDNLRRLTVHEAYDEHPRFSPDGSKIAFVSNRFGQKDIFEINLSDYSIHRKTYYDSPDQLPSWGMDGQLHFLTRRANVAVEREMEAYYFSPELATPNRFFEPTLMRLEPSFQEGIYAFIHGICRTTRVAYTGAAKRDIWIYDQNSDTYKALPEAQGQDVEVRWSQEHLYKLTANGDIYQVARMKFGDSSSNFEIITNFEHPGPRYFDVNRDGSVLVYERKGEIWIAQNGDLKLWELTLPQDQVFYDSKRKVQKSGVSDYAISPNAKLAAIEIHGEIFVTANDKEKSRSQNISQHPYKDEMPRWLNDSSLFFVSDRDGKEALYIAESGDEDLPDLLWTYQVNIEKVFEPEGFVTQVKLNEQKSKIAVVSEPGSIHIADIDSMGKVGAFKSVYESWSMPSGLSWSPDGNWIAYSAQDLNFNSEVFIHSTSSVADPINISMHPGNDRQPVWSPDGSKIAFLSDRNRSNYDVWYAWLRASDYRRSKKDWDEMEDLPAIVKKRLKLEADTSETEALKLDTDDIHRRLVQLTRYSGNESHIAFDEKGEHIFFTKGDGNKRFLHKINWKDKKEETLFEAKGLRALSLNTKDKKLYYLSKGKLFGMPTGKKKGEAIAFAAELEVDLKAELAQVFDEATRQLEFNFYDPHFHGKDFEALQAIYRPICLQASTKQDFRDMYNEMLGHLNASHMGLYGKNPEEVQKEKSGKLGASYKATTEGLEITHIIPKSPLDAEEINIAPGDLITKINGQSISTDQNAYALLRFKNNERIWIEYEDQNGKKYEIYPRALSSVSQLLYEEWVDERRKLTEKYSNGRLGYIHVRGMNWSSFEEFERELMASGYNKDGIIIDVRYNGGGWTTDMLMTVLNVKQHAYTIPRGATEDLNKHEAFQSYYPYGERLPLAWWTKPAAALCNSSSYSNAEIFSHAFKNLNRGPLIGEPTFGAVISTGGKGLMDGSFVRLPFRGWFVKKDGKNMDFHPAVPDHIVELSPIEKQSKEDPQLLKAVNVLLEDLD